jgi:hypothetical protein
MTAIRSCVRVPPSASLVPERAGRGTAECQSATTYIGGTGTGTRPGWLPFDPERIDIQPACTDYGTGAGAPHSGVSGQPTIVRLDGRSTLGLLGGWPPGGGYTRQMASRKTAPSKIVRAYDFAASHLHTATFPCAPTMHPLPSRAVLAPREVS